MSIDDAVGRALEALAEKLEVAEAEVVRLKQVVKRERIPDPGADAFGVGFALPVPRLQMSVVDDSGGGFTAWTGLVTRAFLDRTVLRWVQVEYTMSSSGLGPRTSMVREPHRGSCHLRHDADTLGLPAFVIDHNAGLWARVGTSLSGLRYVEQGALADLVAPVVAAGEED